MTEIDRNTLKVQALLEKISSMTAQYENQIADLRVELTISESERERLENEASTSKDNTDAKKKG